MDKQEVIEKLKEYGAWCTECHDIHGEKDRYVKVAKVRELLEKLDEPQKVKVPAYVEEHIEYSDSANWSLLESIQEMNGNVGSRELANWFEAHSEDYARAWLDGYEVEEETKWIVCYSTMYLKSPLETGQIESVEITPKKELAYHFKSYKEAKQQTSLIGGAVEQVEV